MSERVRGYLAGEPADRRQTWLLCPRCLQAWLEPPAITTTRPGGRHWHADAGRWCEGPAMRVAAADGAGRVRVGSEREGWRARLANVERLLTEALEPSGRHAIEETVGRALAEVRSMIDGDETTT